MEVQGLGVVVQGLVVSGFRVWRFWGLGFNMVWFGLTSWPLQACRKASEGLVLRALLGSSID